MAQNDAILHHFFETLHQFFETEQKFFERLHRFFDTTQKLFETLHQFFGTEQKHFDTGHLMMPPAQPVLLAGVPAFATNQTAATPAKQYCAAFPVEVSAHHLLVPPEQ